jgi:dihydroorotate dehydrogenase
MDQFTAIRNIIIHFLYRLLLKPIFFLNDPEKVHDRMVKVGERLGRYSLGRKFTRIMFSFKSPILEQSILGIRFKNPIGLSAGFDKNAQLTGIMPSVGFGFEEVGSITGEACSGNAKPRLWRLKKSKGLLVYYGLKNDGAGVLAGRLKDKKFSFPLGISIAKTNSPETCDLEAGIEDYLKTYQMFSDIGDYFTLNISCPNAFGGQPFTDKNSLNKLLSKVDKLQKTKPVFIKLSPDLSNKEIDDILDVVSLRKIDGFVISNLTKNRSNPSIKDDDIPLNGGVSGKVVEDLANNLISYVYKKTNGRYVIIGCGGVFNAEDAYKKIKLGATLIQI